MNRFLVESPHELEDCVIILQQIKAMGYLHNFDWGCEAGEHTGWAIVEVENEEQARLVVPPLVRDQAHIVKLTKFSSEKVDSFH